MSPSFLDYEAAELGRSYAARFTLRHVLREARRGKSSHTTDANAEHELVRAFREGYVRMAPLDFSARMQLETLARAMASGFLPGPSCSSCGCTEEDCSRCIRVTGEPCRWILPDRCSACGPMALTSVGTRVLALLERSILPRSRAR